MSFFNTMNVSASALTAQRLRMDVISENLANANTTRTADGGPFRRKTVIFEEMSGTGRGSFSRRSEGTRGSFSRRLESAINRAHTGNGVRVSNIVDDQRPGTRVFDPAHPDSDDDGYVTMPNVNVVEEMVNMISASRSYEANITAISTTRAMIARTLEISR